MNSDLETDFLSHKVFTSKINESPTDGSIVYKFTSLSELRNYDRIEKHNKDWDAINRPIFPVVYTTRDVTNPTELGLVFKGITQEKCQGLMKMENLLNHPKGCSQLAFKLGRFSFDKNASEKKIERKRLIDDNTTSKTYHFRRTMCKLVNEETGEVSLEEEKAYKVENQTYDFTNENLTLQSNYPYLEALIQNEI